MRENISSIYSIKPSNILKSLELNFLETKLPVQTDSFRSSFRSLMRKAKSETIALEKSIHKDWELSIERRAAIDVGSGSTKICIADVDPKTNKIIRVIFEKSFAVPYQTYLEASSDLSFNAEIQERGIAIFSQIKEILDENQVERIAAVATEAFRKSTNGAAFAKIVGEKTGIALRVISQHEEGEIGFYSGVAAADGSAEDVLIWDIGTGSFQITVDDDNEVVVYMQSMGSVPFKNYLIEEIQGKDSAQVTSPNPISEEDWKKADALARAMGRKAYPLIKDKVRAFDGTILGIGRLFANSVKPIGEENGIITRDDLRAFIRASLNKTDEELNDPFANVNVTNCILVLGVMKSLHIHEINILDTTSTKGMLSYGSYWDGELDPVC